MGVDAIHVGVATMGGDELWTDSVPVDLRPLDADEAYLVIAEVLDGQIRRLPADRALVSVEMGLPGHVDRDRGVVNSSRILGWEDVPIRELLGRSLWDAGITNPVHVGVASDCQLAGLYAGRVELQLPPNLVAVYFGGLRSLGTGLLIDGNIFGGAEGGAGDLAHSNVGAGDDGCWCGRQGCLQSALSPVALLTHSALMPRAGAEQMVAERPFEALTLITDAAEAGDERVLSTLTSAGEALGTVLDDVLGSLNPHAAILGGYLGRIWPHLMTGVESKLASRIATQAYSSTRIVALENTEARVVGGAVLAARDAVLAEPMRLTRAVA